MSVSHSGPWNIQLDGKSGQITRTNMDGGSVNEADLNFKVQLMWTK